MVDPIQHALLLPRSEVPSPTHKPTEEEVVARTAAEVAKLLTMSQTIKTWQEYSLKANTQAICRHMRRTGTVLKNQGKDIPKCQELRKLVALTCRGLSVEMHNTKGKTDMAYAIMQVVKEEFSDIPELKDQLAKDEAALKLQFEALKRAGKLPSPFPKPVGAATLISIGDSMLARGNAKFAVDYYRQATDLESPEGRVKLAKMLSLGMGAEKDEKEACRYLCQAAADGHGPAMAELAKRLETGLGVEKDDDLALGWMKRAVEAGDDGAANLMGMRYLKGQGVPRDPAEGARWIRKGAQAGGVEAMWNLASLYETGLGVPKDRNQALSWYEKVGEKGHPEAAFMAARIYEHEKNDLTKARRLYTRSAGGGSLPACREAARMAGQGLGGNADFNQAAELRKKVLTLGGKEPGDYLALGVALMTRAKDEDLPEARKNLEEARRLGHPEADARLHQLQQLENARALEEKRQKQKKNRNRLIGVAAVIVLLVGACLGCMLAGRAALEKGEYKNAVTLLTIGQIFDKEAYRDACFGRGVEFLEQGLYRDALRLLERSGKTGSPEACYARALATVLAPANRSSEDIIAQLCDNMEKAGDYSDAAQYLKLAQLLDKGCYSSGLEIALERNPEQTGELTIRVWTGLLEKLTVSDEAEKALLEECLDAWNEKRLELGDEDSFRAEPTVQCQLSEWTSYNVLDVESVRSIQQRCSGSKDGKVLILRGHREFGSNTITYGIDRQAMDCVPADLIAGSFEEARFLMVIEYDFQDSPTGDYSFGTQGLQEIATLTVTDLKTNRLIYDSGLIIGADSPYSFTYSGAAPKFKTGGPPQMGKYLREALLEIIH